MRFIALFRDAFLHLKKNDPLILAAATSFFTTFSISPTIVLLINLFGIYFKDDEIRSQLINKLEGIFGKETSSTIEGIVKNVNSQQRDWLMAAGGIIFLFFIATTVLKVVKQALNKMWSIKRKHVSRLKYNFSERAVAFVIIVFSGMLITVSVLLDTTVALLSNYLSDALPHIQVLLIRVINILFSIVIGTVWFTILFKVLPDAKLHWRIAAFGGFITALLFNVGKWILGKLLLYNFIADIFGPSASFVLILLFIFYSSFIFYYGAAITYVYGLLRKMPIHAGKYSEEYVIRAVEADKKQTD